MKIERLRIFRNFNFFQGYEHKQMQKKKKKWKARKRDIEKEIQKKTNYLKCNAKAFSYPINKI